LKFRENGISTQYFTVPENVKAVFDKYSNEEMILLLKSNINFYKRAVDNEKLRG